MGGWEFTQIDESSGVLTMDKPKATYDDAPIVPPPSTMDVDFKRKPILYLPNGKVLVIRAGF